MWRRRILHGVVLLGSASALTISCSGSTAVDINYGKDAGVGFDAPVHDGTSGGGAGGNAAPVVTRARADWGSVAAATPAPAELGVQPTPGVPIEMKQVTGRTASIHRSLPTSEPSAALGCGVKVGRHRDAGRLRQLSAEFSSPRGSSRAHVPDLSEPVAPGAGRRRRRRQGEPRRMERRLARRSRSRTWRARRRRSGSRFFRRPATPPSVRFTCWRAASRRRCTRANRPTMRSTSCAPCRTRAFGSKRGFPTRSTAIWAARALIRGRWIRGRSRT